MEVTFQLAKNNEETVSINKVFLHSSYDPIKEAQRFSDSLLIPYTPEYIFITEPGLSYCVPFLRKRFPNSKLCVIRLVKEFEKYNSLFDFSMNYFENKDNFEQILSNTFSEDKLLKSYFINWKNSERIFSEELVLINSKISSCLNQAKTLLITRQYFERKWLLNSINNLVNFNDTVYLKGEINKPVLIISSGPSLNDCLPIIKKFRSSFFVICLSSAISVCKYNNVTPDLYMSTDGGYWAGQHLKKLNCEIPLALPFEGFCSKSLLNKQKILPLKYNDELLSDFIEENNLISSNSKRNGTVAGTALTFALENCNMPIYITGIDMANQKGFQHSQPNEIELNNCINDNNIATKELRAVRSEFSNGSLDIYKNWFQNYNFPNNRVFRIIDQNKKKNTLGKICDINPGEFETICSKIPVSDEKFSFVETKITVSKSQIMKYIDSINNTEQWTNQLFPLDKVSLSHNPNNQELIYKMKERNEILYKKIRAILHE